MYIGQVRRSWSETTCAKLQTRPLLPRVPSACPHLMREQRQRGAHSILDTRHCWMRMVCQPLFPCLDVLDLIHAYRYVRSSCQGCVLAACNEFSSRLCTYPATRSSDVCVLRTRIVFCRTRPSHGIAHTHTHPVSIWRPMLGVVFVSMKECKDEDGGTCLMARGPFSHTSAVACSSELVSQAQDRCDSPCSVAKVFPVLRVRRLNLCSGGVFSHRRLSCALCVNMNMNANGGMHMN